MRLSLWRQWFFGRDEIERRLKNYECPCYVQCCIQSDGKMESRTILCCLLEAQRALLCSLHEMSRLYALSCILRYSLPSILFLYPLVICLSFCTFSHHNGLHECCSTDIAKADIQSEISSLLCAAFLQCYFPTSTSFVSGKTQTDRRWIL